MLGVKLGNFEFLLTCEVHHKDIEWIRARKLSILNLHSYDLYKVLEVLIVVLPIAAVKFCVHESHKGVWLIYVQRKCLFLMLQSLVQLTLKFEDVSKA